MWNLINNRNPHLILAGIIVMSLMLMTACEQSPAPAVAPATLIRVGASYWPGQYWVDIANKQGWFAEAGLNVVAVDTNADYFASFDDLFLGKLDIVAFTQFDFIRYNARGQRVTAFLASDYSNGADALIARPGIERIRDLAGKKLGLSKGTYFEYLWATAARQAGLKPGAVHIVDISAEKSPERLERGEVDAVFTWEPYATQALTQVKGKRLFDTSQVAGLSWVVFSARPEFLEQHAVEIQAFTVVWQRTTQFIRDNPDAAYAIVAGVNNKSLAEVRDFAAQDRILDLRDNLAAFSFAAGYDSLHGSTRQMNEYMVQHGMAKKMLDTTELFDSRFVRTLKNTEMQR